MYRPFAHVLPAIVLAACSSVAPSTLASLAATSPLKADPGAIAVALVLPPGLAVTPGTAELTLDIARADTGEHRIGTYILADAAGVGANISVAKDETLHVFQLSQTDANAMQKLQADLAAWEQDVPDGMGSAAVSLGVAGCAIAAGPAKDAVASAYIRTKADGAFLPLIDKEPLAKLLGEDIAGLIKACP